MAEAASIDEVHVHLSAVFRFDLAAVGAGEGGLDQRIAVGREHENRVEYWLKIIQSFGGDSPVIVICNKSDQRELDFDWRGLKKKYPNNIKDFVKKVSCKTGEGIAELKNKIKREIINLEHIHDELLSNWFTVKTRLEVMNEDYISLARYRQICEDEGIIDEKSQDTLVDFLHDLGIVLHFSDHPILKDTNVLNPEWVTKGVYKILNTNELFQNKGVLKKEDINHILDSKVYPEEKQHFIIDMMKKFELCFSFEGYNGERFLIPDLLPREELETGEWYHSLIFQYRYDVLPSSVISRFIVRMHTHISKHTYWRSGVVLVSENDENKALIKADLEDKKIFIYVKGKKQTRRNFLKLIRAEFLKIHVTIPGLRFKEIVTLIDNPAVEIDYEDLLDLEKKGFYSYYYPKARKSIDVMELLYGSDYGKLQDETQKQDNKNLQDRKLIPCNCSYCKNSQSPYLYSFEILNKFSEDGHAIQCQKSYEMIDPYSLFKGQPDYDEFYRGLYSNTRKVSEKAVFISYAWGGESEEVAKQIEQVFKEKGIKVIRDKHDLEFKGRIKHFMETIGRGRCVIVIISKKYLESENCMFELMQIAKNGKFYNRIFPIILDDARIYKSIERLNYIKYWEQQINELNESMKSVSAANLQGFREDIDMYTQIRNTIAELTNILRGMNTLTLEIHRETIFNELFKAIIHKVVEES